MEIEVLTKEDLQAFRLQMLSDLKELLSTLQRTAANIVPPKLWLKNAEVRDLLGISSNTIQRLRISGKLRSTKVGGVHYYRYEDLEKLLNGSDETNISGNGKC
jgi:hypothetical protein